MIYAVNKRTKEHRVSTPGEPYSLEWHFEEADPDGWIEWPGGECPLPDGGTSEIRMSNGDEFLCDDPEEMAWGDNRRYENIIAYRPILDANTKVSHPGTMAGPDKFRADGGEPPARDGSGMPRAGSLACTSGGDCEVVTTDAARGQVCVRWNDGELGVVPIGVVKPRPIRSEEDRAVDAMWAAYERGDRKGGRPETMREVYRAIRDGKVPGVKLAGGE